jgi:hypothetical protein
MTFQYIRAGKTQKVAILNWGATATASGLRQAWTRKTMLSRLLKKGVRLGQAHFPTERLVDSRTLGSLKNRQTPFFSSLSGSC